MIAMVEPRDPMPERQVRMAGLRPYLL